MNKLSLRKSITRRTIKSTITALVIFLPLQAIAAEKDMKDAVAVDAVSSEEIEKQPVTKVEDLLDAVPTLPAVKVETTQADRSHTMTVITRDDTEGVHFTNMNDALFSGTPGVATSRRSETGFGGPNSGFLIRGLQGPHVPVFVDGIPIQVNNHFHARVDRYSSDMIDSMEITRGASVLKHGASAVGGAIDIYTRNPGKGVSGFFQAAAGRYDTREVYGDFGFGWDGGSVLLSASDRLTDGRTPINGFDAGTPFAEAHDLTNVNFKVNQAIDDTWSVGLRYSNAKEDPFDLNYEPGYQYFRFFQDETDFVVHLDRKTATSNTLIAYHDDTLDNSNARITDGVIDIQPPGPLSPNPRKETENGFLVRHTMLRSGGNTTTFGVHAVEYTDDRFTGSANSDETDHISAYVQLSQGLGNGIRVDGGVRVTEGDEFDTDVSPEIGIVKKVDSSFAVRARAGKAFRVPRLGDTDTSNTLIEPEDFVHVEIGANKMFGESGVFDVAIWAMEGDNLIVGSTGAKTNTGEFSNNGVELSVDYRVNNAISVFAAATLMSLETTSPSPQKMYDLGVEYRKDRIRANIMVRNGSDNADIRLEDSDYTVVDARIQYQVTNSVDVFVNIDNLTDTEYSTRIINGPMGARVPGAQVQQLVMLGARVKY